jgi:hypothetical protein
MKRKTIVQENITPPLDELGEIRGMSISKTTTAKSCKKQKKDFYTFLSRSNATWKLNTNIMNL